MLRKRVCFAGYGSTGYSRKSEEPLLWYYAEAIRSALRQTGLKKSEIQGLSITTQASPDYSPHVAEQLGLELDWVLNGDYGGAGGVMSVRRAADAIEAGHTDIAVLVGGNSFDKSVAHQRVLEYQRANYVDVYGYGGPNSLMALIQRLHMERFGTTLEQIGKIAVAQRENALLFYADEALISLIPYVGRSWAIPGSRPIVRVSGKRGEHVGVTAAVNQQGRMCFELTKEKERFTGRVFIRFLKKMHKEFPGRGIILIVDGAPIHKSKLVKAFVKTNEHWLSLEVLPAYSPELNPTEKSWRFIKTKKLNGSTVANKKALRKATSKALRETRKDAQRVLSFFD